MTFRLEDGKITEVQDPNKEAPVTDFDPSCIVDTGEDLSHRNNSDSGNESIVRNAIKSRKNIQSTMKTLPFPGELWKLTLICFVLCVAAVAIAIIGHVFSVNLYEALSGQVDILATESEEYRCLMEANSVILQMVSVNEFVFFVKVFAKG